MPITLKRIFPDNEHERQKWYVLEGSVDGCPAVTKRVSIAVSALVQNPALLAQARAKLEADVAEYHANFIALEGIS